MECIVFGVLKNLREGSSLPSVVDLEKEVAVDLESYLQREGAETERGAADAILADVNYIHEFMLSFSGDDTELLLHDTIQRCASESGEFRNSLIAFAEKIRELQDEIE